MVILWYSYFFFGFLETLNVFFLERTNSKAIARTTPTPNAGNVQSCCAVVSAGCTAV